MVHKGALAITAALTALVAGTVAGIAWGMSQGKHDEERASSLSVTSGHLVTPISSTIVAPHEAIKAALDYTGGRQADDVRLVLRGSGFVYEVRVGQEVIPVDAVTGRILGAKVESEGSWSGGVVSPPRPTPRPTPQGGSQGSLITAEEAQRIALAATGDSYVRKVKPEREYGLLVYKVKTEYHEVYVDAATGKVLSIEREDGDD